MYLNEFFEDNGGVIFCFVYDGAGKPVNCVELMGDESIESVLESCKEGWPYADPYDPENYNGMTIPEFRQDFENWGAQQIAEIAGYSKPILFPNEMGCAGTKLFKKLLEQDDAEEDRSATV